MFQILEMQELFCKLMVRFMCIIETNSFALEEPTPLTLDRFKANDVDHCVLKHQVGTVLYLTPSYFNHSCDPNVCFIFDKRFLYTYILTQPQSGFIPLLNAFLVYRQNIVMCTTKLVNLGEELNISYGPNFSLHTRSQRRSQINPYDFECQCKPCLENWPLCDKIPNGLVPKEVLLL